MKTKTIVIILILVIVLACSSLLTFMFLKNNGSSNRSYENTIRLVHKYVDKEEYDRALSLLDNLLIQNPDDEEILALFDKIIEAKKNTSGQNSVVQTNPVNPNISLDFDASEFSDAMQSALDKQAKENQRVLEENQKAMKTLMENQKTQAEKDKKALEEKREEEKLLAERKKAEEEKRKKAEEELAKKNAKLKKEIDEVNEQIRLGKTALATGNIDEAMSFFNKAKNLLPVSAGEPEFSASKNSEIACALYDAAEKTENPSEKKRLMEESVKMAKSAIVSNPKDSASHNVLGQDALARKDYQTALDEFKKAVQYDTDSSNFLYYYNLGKTQYALKRYSEAVSSFTTAADRNKTYSQTRYNLGLAQLKLGNDTLALDAFRKAIDLNPRYEKAFLEQARILEKRGDHKGAIQSYKKVEELNNVNTAALMEMGHAYFKDNKFKEAEESYLKALALLQEGSDMTLTCHNLSTVLYEEKKYSEALKYAKRAHDGLTEKSANKDKTNITYNYALLLEKTGKTDDAIPLYIEVLKYDPNHNKTKNNLGLIYLADDDVDSALALFLSVYESENKNYEANINLGTAYLRKEDFKNAVKFFQNALKIKPEDNDVRINLARAYARSENYEAAKTTYMEICRNDKQNLDAYLELAKVCMKLNDNYSAEGYLIYVQDKDSSFHKDEVEDLLSALELTE